MADKAQAGAFKNSEALSERRLSFGGAMTVNSLLSTNSILRMATKRHELCIMKLLQTSSLQTRVHIGEGKEKHSKDHLCLEARNLL